MTYPTATVKFFYAYTLEECGRLISANLLGGTPFVGLDECIMDEIPAVYAECEILGFRIVLAGHGGERGYGLQLIPGDSAAHAISDSPSEPADLSSYIVQVLSAIPGIEHAAEEMDDDDE
jgi:hypothetical protein